MAILGKKMSGTNRKTDLTYSDSTIINKIHIIRGLKVMIDRDLAEMYAVPTSRLNEAVKRNSTRFPEDFMFQLTDLEYKNLMSQFAISSLPKGAKRWGGNRKLPLAFTEQGVAMLSSVLHSEHAIQVNIRIVRVYIKIKQVLMENTELWKKIEKIEQTQTTTEEQVKSIFNILKKLLVQEAKPKRKIGFEISQPK